MIKTLEINNFKSIKQLKLDCKRINILIGEPNTGKSNILETLGLFSWMGNPFNNTLKEFVRLERTNNLFYDENLEEIITVKADEFELGLKFRNGTFEGNILRSGTVIGRLGGNYDTLSFQGGKIEPLSLFKYYKFIVQQVFQIPESDYLLPPSGKNLMSLILAHKELRTTVNQIFSKFGFRLNMRPQENRIEVIKQMEDISVSYPYSLTSDTIQRIIFYLCAILSNRASVLVFEEPESHSFPYYTKYFAETVALDDRKNQYFITTHNPYLLLPIVQKAPRDDVAVFITYFEDYQTRVRPLKSNELEELLDIDVFANLDRFLETK